MSTYTPIATQTLASTAASVTFSSIPQGYTDLVLVIQGTHTSTGNNWIGLQYNQDTGTTYSSTVVRGDGSSATSSRNTSDNYAGRTIITSTLQSNAIYQIQNYSNSTTYKTCLARSNGDEVDMSVGLWRNTAAIATVTIVNIGTTFSSGTTFSLYGIQVGDKAQKAQGGNTVTSDGTYVYHTFTSSGSFIPSQALTVDYLVVAGGGGGGNGAGGGGAGGMRCTVTNTGGGGTLESALSLTAKSYPVIIGAGGTSQANGNNSVFATITSTGGGCSPSSGDNGTSGGSGGGGGRASNTGGARTASPVQGNNGGDAGGFTAGGGGGGAGAAGSVGTTGNNGGAGGNGIATSITGSSVTYAGGGGAWGASTAGAGGTGGGGAGSTAGNGTAGTANTGSGGGGGSTVSGGGGSGIVIIRYAI
jgi:hypothetical protein